jgi:ParB/RepB/Spo0J family partition protein
MALELGDTNEPIVPLGGVPSERFERIPIGKLLPNKTVNPRKELRELDELVASITEHGILVPLMVERFGGNFRVVAGHRRLAAAKQLGLSDLPCIVREVHDELTTMLVENCQRDGLKPLELGEAYQALSERGLGPTAIAKRIGRAEAHVVHHLKLYRLPVEHPGRQAVARGESSVERAIGYTSEQRCPTCGHLVRRKGGLTAHNEHRGNQRDPS